MPIKHLNFWLVTPPWWVAISPCCGVAPGTRAYSTTTAPRSIRERWAYATRSGCWKDILQR